jgi:hypothetical protein
MKSMHYVEACTVLYVDSTCRPIRYKVRYPMLSRNIRDELCAPMLTYDIVLIGRVETGRVEPCSHLDLRLGYCT